MNNSQGRETTAMNTMQNAPLESYSAGGGLGRRDILRMSMAAATGSSVLSASADVGAATFGSPVVELCVPAGALTLEQKSAMVKGLTDVVLGVLKLTPDPARRMFVAITESAEGGFGVDGQVFVPSRK
jgi:phenylpyruvate tautomerase PptA (4-oxalocrotonate tautomerase family)